ncbi:MAG: hypothetical protein ACJ789_05170 [Thermomicrobiales bacterium]
MNLNVFNKRLDAVAHELAKRPQPQPVDVDLRWFTAEEVAVMERVGPLISRHPQTGQGDFSNVSTADLRALAAIVERAKKEYPRCP